LAGLGSLFRAYRTTRGRFVYAIEMIFRATVPAQSKIAANSVPLLDLEQARI